LKHVDLGGGVFGALDGIALLSLERGNFLGVFGEARFQLGKLLLAAGRLAEAGVDDPLSLPLGVDTDTFRPDVEGTDLRSRLGLEPRHRILVFAGRPAREKRVDVLIEAVERLGDPYVLVLIGATGAAQDFAARQPCAQVFDLPYERDPRALAALLSSCDAFVHANDAEPFGLVVLEAMACGLPVIGVNSGGVRESVDESVGQLADRSTAQHMAEAVESLFSRDIKAVGRAARIRAMERHSWDHAFSRLAWLYRELTGGAAFTDASGAASARQ